MLVELRSRAVVFFGTFGCTSQGYVKREGDFSCFSLERGNRITGLALLAFLKWWFSVALFGAQVRGI